MLDFMREQENKDSSLQQQNAGVDNSNVDNSSAPTSRDGQGYISVTDQGKNARKSTILLAVLFGIGMLCLVFMIKKTTPQAASAAISAEEIQIEKIVASMGGDKNQASNDIDEVVKQFSEFSNVQQVRDLVKNPFKHEIFLGDALNNAEFNLDFGSGQDGLELFSIMKSSDGKSGWCCMIDDKLLYEGDSIRGFKVLKISKNTVILESGEMETILKLTE